VLAGAWIFPELPWLWLAVMAAILAPTDAALGIAILLNESVPQRVRDTLNVESGLNDGLVVPPLMALLAAAAASAPTAAAGQGWVLDAAGELAFGALIGVLFGWAGGRLLDGAWKRGWIDETFARLVTPGLALLTFVAAHLLDKNGFVAAYVAGLTLAVGSPELRERLHHFGEADGSQFALFVFVLFGYAMVPVAAAHWDAAALAYALASLTVVRMLPVWISLLGSGLDTKSALFVGWSGPRGIASVLYLALVVQQFGMQGHERLFGVVVLTVLLSVFLHGMSAAPLSAAYGRSTRQPRQR
jgi:NhaP-type Na+/H+ or K+/H+ antiporter